MKKKLSFLVVLCMMVSMLFACGKGDSENGGVLSFMKQTKELKLETVTASMIEAAYYIDTDEYKALCGLISSGDGKGVCIFAVSVSGNNAIVTGGIYEPETKTGEDGLEISYLTYTDAFTGSEKSLGLVQDTVVLEGETVSDLCVILDDNSVYDLDKTDANTFVTALSTIGISSYNMQTVITTWQE